MNNLFAIILFLLIPVLSQGQRCNYEKDKVDEETKMVIRRTAPVTLCKLNGHPFIFKSQQIGDRKYLKLRYYRYNNFSIIEGSKFIFYFDNGDKLMIEPLEIKKAPNAGQNGFATVSSLLVYQLEKDDFNALLNNPVTQIGVYTNTGLTKQEVKQKQQNEIQYLLECIN